MSGTFGKMAGTLQQIGKSLMFPVAILPVAGILLGVGASHLSFIPEVVSSLMSAGGRVIFDNLPLIFAVGVALGLTNMEGAAALSAVAGFLVMTSVMAVMATEVLGLGGGAGGFELRPVLGIPSIDTGVFGGILIGLVASFLYNRFYRIELPPYLAFFSGKRFVPIVTGLSAILVGVVLSFLWPPVAKLILVFSNWAAYSNPSLAGALYGVVERLLLPLGLHHAWNVPFFFEIGSFEVPVTGQIVHGDINRFFAGDPTAGILSGGFLVKMWGLPMAAIAIWHSARPENRARVGSLMLSAALTSFLTGITEPIEFSFMFVAPALYVVHAILTGAASAIMNLFGAHLGYTFSQGGIDFMLYWGMDTKPWLNLVLGPIYGGVYYVLFRGWISFFNPKTPGREIETGPDADVAAALADGGPDAISKQILLALGGRSNITTLGNCVTRLRVDVVDPGLVDAKKLKDLGAAGVVSRGTAVQAVFGTRVGNIKSDIDEYLTRAGDGPELAEDKARLLRERSELLKDKARLLRDRPGRGGAESDQDRTPKVEPERLTALLAALGGTSNIVSAEPLATTRLLAIVKDRTLVSPEAAKAAGLPILVPARGGAVQVVVGPKPERYRGLLSALE